ncbi:hypothetical protein AAFC00_001028 [Neodothiora populina]|uniref:Fe2OG dioxygenase domain-containing protein n=1 Tax=Neodothiora populina TaxID=2781224 RepID=A0ABR3PNL5_9PEZI
MDAFISRKRKHCSQPESANVNPHDTSAVDNNEDDSTEVKLACLASLDPDASPDALLDALLACEGNVEEASRMLSQSNLSPFLRKNKISRTVGYQSSLFNLIKPAEDAGNSASARTLTKKGKTLFLYSPEDIETHTPCSMIHNFLPNAEADALLKELLAEPPFGTERFVLFDRAVESPRSVSFYTDSIEDANEEKTPYFYNGSKTPDIRLSTPEMRKASHRVALSVNAEIQRRIRDFYPRGQKLKYQSPRPWQPNIAVVNCYDGPRESLGYHSDQLTYLGPRAVIGSLSLGVAREFRVRRVIPKDSDDSKPQGGAVADTQGQISIQLPHNSLLIMHAEMQEQWKHSVAPATSIDPHPLAGNKRINITYRHAREAFHPRYTPKCDCGVPTTLRCVQQKKQNLGRYMWMCHSGYTPGQTGCTYFKWAEFDDDGEPPWTKNKCS